MDYQYISAQLPPLPPGIVVDTASKDMVKLINSERGTIIRDGDHVVNVVVGSVAFEHNGDMLYADSARLNLTTNTVAAYGDVSVIQTDGTNALADRLFYNGKTNVVELYGDVELSSGGDMLWAEKVVYNLKTQIGSYTDKGTLQSGNTVVSSHNAVYNVKTKNARFKRDVIVIDPEYEVNSQDLNYNTDTRLVTFYAPSVIQNDSATLYTEQGTYDAAMEIATFNRRSTIVTQGQYMTANKMSYNRQNGLGIGTGSVVAIDSTRHITMWGEYGTINEITKQVMMTQRPIVKIVQDSSDMYIKADTFYTEPISILIKFRNKEFTEGDSILLAFDLLQRAAAKGLLADSNEVRRLDSLNRTINVDTTSNLDALDTDRNTDSIVDTQSYVDTSISKDTVVNQIDTSSYRTRTTITTDSVAYTMDSASQQMPSIGDVGVAVDTLSFDNVPVRFGSSPVIGTPTDSSEIRYILAYRNVLVYNDSVQAKCDSLSYSQLDSIMQMFYNPVVWTRDAQIVGNTIIAKVDSSTVQWVRVPQNGIMVSQSFPGSTVAYDQLQGNELQAYFTANEIDSVIAKGSSASIYYAKDDQDALIGISDATANDIHIRFGLDSVQQRRIKEIIYYQDFEQTMHPISKVSPEDMRLSRFIWRDAERPKSLDDFLKAVDNDAASKPINNSVKKDTPVGTNTPAKKIKPKKKKRK